MNSKQVATIGILGSLVTLLSLTLSHYFKFPILPYLEFDPAEIIVMLAFLLFGPVIAIAIEFIHFVLLNVFSSFPIIGPALKSAAVFSTLLGYYLSFIFLKRSSYAKIMVLGISFAILLRVAILTLLNYLVFITIYAGFVTYAANSIYLATGIKASSTLESLFLILIFTAIFNIIHVFFTVIPSTYLARLQTIQKVTQPISYPWFLKFLDKN